MLALWICWYISMGLMTCLVSKIYRLSIRNMPLRMPYVYVPDRGLVIIALFTWPLVLLVGVYNLHEEAKQ